MVGKVPRLPEAEPCVILCYLYCFPSGSFLSRIFRLAFIELCVCVCGNGLKITFFKLLHESIAFLTTTRPAMWSKPLKHVVCLRTQIQKWLCHSSSAGTGREQQGPCPWDALGLHWAESLEGSDGKESPVMRECTDSVPELVGGIPWEGHDPTPLSTGESWWQSLVGTVHGPA